MSVVLVTTRRGFVAEDDRLYLTGLTLHEGTTILSRQGITERIENGFETLVESADEHPLLLDLAASWLRQEAGGQIAEAALGFFERLFRNYQGNPEAKVNEIFAALFSALPERLQSLLLGVVVYRDRFGLEMAQAILLDASIADLQVLEEGAFLRSLSSEKWTLHPLMLRSVQQALRDSGQEREAHERAIAYFAANIRAEKETITDCAEELEIFHHCCELGEYDLANQIMDTCVNFLKQRGYCRSLLPIYDRLTYDWALENSDDAEDQRNLGGAWTQLGILYQSMGEYQAAIAAHKKAQTLFNNVDFSEGKAASLGNLGNAYRSLGQYERAIDFQQQQYEIAREIGDRSGEVASLGNLGIAYQSLGQHERAIDFQQQQYEIAREIGDRGGEAGSLGNLGTTYGSLGQYERVIDFQQQSLEIRLEIGDRWGEATSLFNKAQALAKFEPRRFEALATFQQAREIFAG